MPLPVRRAYAGAAEACTLSSSLNNSATSFSITGTTTAWPSTATGPFYMVIDPGLSTEEKVLVGARTGGSLSSVTRGVDGTSAAAHDAGASCYPVLAAVDLNEANLLASTLTTKGDLLSTDGSDPKRVAVGSNNTRLVADSAQTSGIKWVADTQNTVIDAKGDLLVGSAADTVARLAVGANGKVLEADSGETTGLKWGGTLGLEYVAGGSFTNVASFNVTGFASTYQTYVLQLYGYTASGQTDVLGTLYNGATARNSSYYGGGVYGAYNGTTGSKYAQNNTTFFTITTWANLYRGNCTLTIFRASGEQPTWNVTGFDGNGFSGYVSGGFRNSTDAWDTISVSGASYNLTGTWRLYGYREP